MFPDSSLSWTSPCLYVSLFPLAHAFTAENLRSLSRVSCFGLFLHRLPLFSLSPTCASLLLSWFLIVSNRIGDDIRAEHQPLHVLVATMVFQIQNVYAEPSAAMAPAAVGCLAPDVGSEFNTALNPGTGDTDMLNYIDAMDRFKPDQIQCVQAAPTRKAQKKTRKNWKMSVIHQSRASLSSLLALC